jgi:hypothetical protein
MPLSERRVAPEFHLIVDRGSNGEVYNVVIRGKRGLSACWSAR